MREAVAILASSTVCTAGNRRSYFTDKYLPKRCAQNRPYLTSVSPRVDNRRGLVYYTELASKLAADGRFDDFMMIAESVVASGVEASEFSALLNTKSVADGIARMLREGKLDCVVDGVLSGVKKLNIDPTQLFDRSSVEAMSGECKRMLKCGKLDEIVDLMETLHGFGFSISKLLKRSDVISLAIKKRNPMTAMRYAQMFPDDQLLFCTIILEFGKKKDLVSALAAFEASKKDFNCPNMHTYRTIIDVCGICGDFLKSRTIIEELLASKVTPNTHVFNSFMNVNACDVSYTMNIYRQMQKLGVTADITSHNILLKSCRLAAKVELAQEIYGEIRNLESNGKLRADVFTYSTMIKVFADSNMCKQAQEIKEDMLSSGVTPNTVTWSSLISSCVNVGLVEPSFKLFEEMILAGGQPNSECINILLHACVKTCQFDRAFRLFQCWKEEDFNQIAPNHIQDSADKYIAMNQMSKNFCISMQHRHLTFKVPFRPTTSTYNIMLKACGNDYNRAKALMDEMKNLGLSPDHITWSILIDIHGSSGNVANAVQILRTMHEIGVEPDVVSYTTAIKVCVAHKNPKLAYLLFAEMKKYRIKPNMVTYNTMLRARSRYGSLQEVQQCLTVYQDMRKAGYKSNDYYLKQLIEEWCEGVIQSRHKEYRKISSGGTDFGHESLLLEKVAEYLQDNNPSIDLRGLTKVEARIVVLAVLRKIKEKYIEGDSVKNDMLIILGASDPSADVSKDATGVTEAIIRLLQQDLGLGIVSGASEAWNDKMRDRINLMDQSLGSGKVIKSGSCPSASEPAARRPVVLQRLKITMESLQIWLRRRSLQQDNKFTITHPTK